MHEQLPPEIREKSPAARLVYTALKDSVHDTDSLQDATGLSKRYIHEIAGELTDAGFSKSYRHPNDQRRWVYYDPDAFDLVEAQQEYASKQHEK